MRFTRDFLALPRVGGAVVLATATGSCTGTASNPSASNPYDAGTIGMASVGAQTGPCYGNGTCNAGLICTGQVCVTTTGTAGRSSSEGGLPSGDASTHGMLDSGSTSQAGAGGAGSGAAGGAAGSAGTGGTGGTGGTTLNSLDCRSAPNGSLTGGNGLNTLNGSTIGTGQVQNTDLRKELTVNQKSGMGLFSIGRTFALRTFVPPGTEPAGFFVVVPVTNISSGPFCLVNVGNVVYKDTSDVVLEGPSTLNSAVLGSHGIASWSYSSQAKGPKTSTSCLASGEVGYFSLAAQTAHYSQVAKLDFDICAGGTDVSEAQTKLNVLSYKWTPASAGIGYLTAVLQNQGSIDASLGQNVQYIVFDANSLPVYHGFLYVGNSVVVTHGTSMTIGSTDPGATIAGSGARLLLAISLYGAP